MESLFSRLARQALEGSIKPFVVPEGAVAAVDSGGSGLSMGPFALVKWRDKAGSQEILSAIFLWSFAPDAQGKWEIRFCGPGEGDILTEGVVAWKDKKIVLLPETGTKRDEALMAQLLNTLSPGQLIELKMAAWIGDLDIGLELTRQAANHRNQKLWEDWMGGGENGVQPDYEAISRQMEEEFFQNVIRDTAKTNESREMIALGLQNPERKVRELWARIAGISVKAYELKGKVARTGARP